MDKLVSHEVYRSFEKQENLFDDLDGDAVATLASIASDIALVIDADGVIDDISYRDRNLKPWKPEEWVGRRWSDVVTVESRDKLSALIQEAESWPVTRSTQVNHAAVGSRDLPVSYRLISFPGLAHRIALGTDLRALADMQQRFVRSQVEMERDYRKLRDIESRYRILFFLAEEPLVVVDSQTLKIHDANEQAAGLFDRPVKKFAGGSVLSLFHKTDQQAVSDVLGSAANLSRAERFSARLTGTETDATVSVTPFREFGRISLLLQFDLDVALPDLAPHSRMAAALETLPEGMVLADERGIILDANPAFLDLVRMVSLDRVTERTLDTWLGGSAVDLQVLMANLREHGVVRRFSTVIRDELGGQETVDVAASAVAGKGGTVYAFAIREAPAMSPQTSDGLGVRQANQFTDLVGRVPLKDLVRDTSDIIEKLCIEAALKLTENNRASAADMLGLSRQSLYIKLRRFGIADYGADDDAS